MTAYYNENNPKAAARLREYIKNGLIADGVVDDRSITDIKPSDLAGFTQVHLFAGIGGWSVALRHAGWPDDRPVWTGSCPCQPYSCAGKKAGKDDERNLWPDMYRLIRERRPDIIFGEQVEDAIRHGWLDSLQTDLETENYAAGHCVLGAHSVGSFHRRQRLYWLAHTNDQQRRSQSRRSGNNAAGAWTEFRGSSATHGLLADSAGEQCQRSANDAGPAGRAIVATSGTVGRLSYAGRQGCSQSSGERDQPERPATTGFWNNPEWIYCRDNKYRPIEPTLKPLAHGLPRGFRNLPVYLQRLASLAGLDGASLRRAKSHRVSSIHGFGNSIVPEVAAEFILAFDEWAQAC